MKKSLLLLGLIVVIASGCTKQLSDFTVLSTKYSSLGNGESNVVKAQQKVKGKNSKMSHLLFIPTGSPDTKKAIENALEQCPGAIGLANGTIKSKSWSCLFFGKSSYYVEGTPIYDANAGNGYQYQQSDYNNSYYQNQYNYQSKPSQKQYQQQNQYNNNTTNYETDYYQNNKSSNNNYSESDDETFIHQVKQGETLKSIAETYDVTIKDLILWNNLKNNAVKPGQKIKINLK